MTDKDSDGCSYVPDHNGAVHSCCDRHDYAYRDQKLSRWLADKNMFNCIRKTGHPIIASIYWLGVRLGGWYTWRKFRK